MKKLIAMFCLLPLLAQAVVPMPPATGQDVIDGTATYKAVTPKALADAGFGAPTNGVTGVQATNIANYAVANEPLPAENITGTAAINITGNATTSTTTTNAVKVINIVGLGAVGDGVTDNTHIIQMAIVNNSNATIFLPAPGVFGVTRSTNATYGTNIFPNKQALNLFTGRKLQIENGATLKLLDSAPDDTPLLLLPRKENSGAETWGSDNIEIFGGGIIDGNSGRAGAGVGSENEGINLKGSTNVTIRDITILNCAQDALDFDASKNVVVENVTARNNWGNGIHALGSGNVNLKVQNSTFVSNSWERAAVETYGAGVDFGSVVNGVIDNCYFSDNHRDIQLENFAIIPIVKDSKFESFTRANTNIWIGGATDVTLNNLEIIVGSLSGVTGIISVSNSAVRLSNSRIYNNNGTGIAIVRAANFEIDSGLVLNNQAAAPYPIHVLSPGVQGGGQLSIKGTRIRSNNGSGVRIAASANVDNMTLADVTLDLSKVHIESGATGTNIQINAKSIGTATTSIGILAAGLSPIRLFGCNLRGDVVLPNPGNRIENCLMEKIHFSAATSVNNYVNGSFATDVQYTSTTAARQIWEMNTGVLSTNNVMRFPQMTIIPTNSIPAGSTTTTNPATFTYNGAVVIVATNHADGGYMRWRTTDETWVAFP